MLHLNSGPKETVLYVKESNSVPAFWGLTKNQLDRLRGSDVRWFVVLLDMSAARGYLLSGGQVEMRVTDGAFELSGDGDHKVNEFDLAASQRFPDVQALLGRLL